MNKINFFFKSFKGKGWFIPLKEILKGTEFYSQAVSLGEMKIFNLADIAKLINNQKLDNTLSCLDLEERKIIDFESYLTKKVEDLKVFDRTQKWIIPGTLIVGIFTYISFTFFFNEKVVVNETGNGVEKIENELIGVWKTPTSYGGGNLSLEKINGVYFKTERFMDNSVSKVEMILSIEGDKMIFRENGRNTTDHFDILKNGKLEVRDKDGLIYVGEIL